MSYFTSDAVIKRLRIGLSKDDGNRPRGGCTEPTAEYGETPGIETFEVGVARGDIQSIPENEWPERLEAIERGGATLFDRIDVDFERALTQRRCGYCWAYAVIAAIMTAMARDGKGERLPHLSAASVAAQIKNGRDQGGWPVEAAEFIAAGNGVCLESEWPDCSCRGRQCNGPRSGCRARDLSQVESTRESAKLTELKFYELPRGREAIRSAMIQASLQLLPSAVGWVGTRSWCDGHAMAVPHVMRKRPGRRDPHDGWRCVPENSWGMYKRRIPVENFPTGGVVVVRADRREAA